MLEYIKEFPSGKIIGMVEKETNNDRIARLFPSREIVGYYRANRDQTTDFYGKIIAKGDCVVSLIYSAKNR